MLYRNVYTYNSNQMMMIKSNGGSGTVKNVVFENFIGRSNAYSLDIDQYWSSMDAADGDGVQLSNITFTNWKGTAANGEERGPIKVICADGAPCTDITIEDFAMWTGACPFPLPFSFTSPLTPAQKKATCWRTSANRRTAAADA